MEALNKLPWAAKSPIFQKVSEISDISALSKEERLKYDHAIKVYRDNLCVYRYAIESGLKEGMEKGMKEGMEKGMEKGMKEGMKEGMKKGIEEGAREKALSIAREMKKLNVDIAFIVKTTGLTIEDIESIG